ncbi:hypothetical protein FKM82_031321, partial [Ascaphus truei]
PGHFSSGSDRRIPLLEEVFQRHPDMPINVEIKEDDRDVIRKVSDMVRRYQRSDRTIWASVNDKVMKKCQAENADMPVIFTPRRGLILLLLYYTGLLPFVPLRECVVETVMPSLINRLIMRKSLLQHLQDRGIQVYFWVLNQDSDFQKALDLGASGLMTDYPCKLQAFLRQHGGTQRERGGTQ